MEGSVLFNRMLNFAGTNYNMLATIKIHPNTIFMWILNNEADVNHSGTASIVNWEKGATLFPKQTLSTISSCL